MCETFDSWLDAIKAKFPTEDISTFFASWLQDIGAEELADKILEHGIYVPLLWHENDLNTVEKCTVCRYCHKQPADLQWKDKIYDLTLSDYNWCCEKCFWDIEYENYHDGSPYYEGY